MPQKENQVVQGWRFCKIAVTGILDFCYQTIQWLWEARGHAGNPSYATDLYTDANYCFWLYRGDTRSKSLVPETWASFNV